MASPSRSWLPTTSHLRAGLAGGGLAILSITFGRPDLLVMATPLLVVCLWSVVTRPTDPPAYTERLAHRTLREGEATRWRFVVEPTPGAEDIVAWVITPGFTRTWPSSGAITGSVDPSSPDAPVRLDVVIRSIRWGRRDLGPVAVAATSAWGAFRWSSGELRAHPTVTLPYPAAFDSTAPTPHPNGLVGLHRSARRGEGSEFSSIRPFQLGDRLRRIHWPVSLRTGELHVTSTWADQDTLVVLLVDASNDIGTSGGVDGTASSLDVAVRAAGAVAEHYLHGGDRVELRIVDASGLTRLPGAAGRHHLRRVLDRLAAVKAGSSFGFDPQVTQAHLSPGALVVMLSPLVSPRALQQGVSLAQHGFTVIVVDTLPAGVRQVDPENPFAEHAWRIRLLERSREVHRARQSGVPIVRWSGPGSLDEILRDVSHRSTAPRMARR